MTIDDHALFNRQAAGTNDASLDFRALDLIDHPVFVVRSDEARPRVVGANAAFRSLIDADPIGGYVDGELADRAPHEAALVATVIDGAATAEGIVERGARRFEVRVVRHGDDIVATSIDVTERESLAAQVAYDASHDLVTGLPNAAAFIDRLAALMARPELSGSGAAVIICDLDQYRAIGDALGPVAASDVLRVIGERLERRLRFGDCVARLAGDEFAVLVCDAGSDDDLITLAERLVETLAEPVELDQDEIYVSASAGIARFGADDDPQRVLRDAHAALSKARRIARGSVTLFDAEVRDDVVRRVEVEKALHRALRNGEFRVHYQPLVRFEGAAIVGFEALLRWEHPERGLVGPLDFIPVAEDTGLIVPIGAWVIEEVCRQAAQWQQDLPGAASLSVSVNLSARQLAHPGLVGTIADALGHAGIAPSTLLVEVTETTIMSDPVLAATILHALRSLGVRIAIDDFGTGHSSLGYLKELPVDCLKIDRSFVSGLDRDPDDRAIVGAVVSMAHALGLSVTAEGVETLEQLDLLEALGCDVGQGFYFAKPQSGEVVTALVRHPIHWRLAS